MAETRIGFGSCVSEYDAVLWETVDNLKLDAFIILGDSVYLDESDLKSHESAYAKYLSLYNLPEFLSLLSKTPVYAQWDDHDFGGTDLDKFFAKRDITAKAFRTFWDTREYDKAVKGSIAGTLKVGDVQLVFTDNRSFRVNQGRAEPPGVFGEQQLKWIENTLAHPESGTVIFASSNQVLTSQTKFESLAQHPMERARILRAIKASPADVLIISGDRHFSEVLKDSELGIYEFSASPLSAASAGDEKVLPDPKRLTHYNAGPSFGMLEIDRGSWGYTIFTSQGKKISAISNGELVILDKN